ncbi:MAG: NfeD family protein [Bacteroidaceae bacterium]|nr:NfeD family protein [Bacteroidaceae bacterium]
MSEIIYSWYEQLDPGLRVYWIIAIITSSLFFIQMMLTFLGLGHSDVDIDTSFDSTPDGGLDGVDGAMQIFTVRNFINFLLGLSWGGICLWDIISNKFILSVASLLIGILFVSIFWAIYRLMMRLQSSGNIRMESAVGAVCQVYLRIPSARKGTGKVQISFSGSVQEVDAQTDGDELPSGARVRVLSLIDDHTLLVTPL